VALTTPIQFNYLDVKNIKNTVLLELHLVTEHFWAGSSETTAGTAKQFDENYIS
jgi:hypothetical protein